MDTEKMMEDLILAFVSTIEILSDNLAAQMKSRAKDSVVSSSIRKEIIWEGFNYIEFLVGSDHWKAFLDNYGTGSMMADVSKNPYLSEYKENYWHSNRPSSAITGRGQGKYTIPDWESGDGYITRESSGVLKGVNLEKVSVGNSQGKYNLRAQPQKPSFFIENSMAFVEKQFNEELMRVYENFPFHKYIKGGQSR